MPVIDPDSAPTFDTGGALITGLAAPSRGSTETAAWRVALRAGHPSPEHALSREEIFVVLDGTVSARYADRTETATAGGALIVAPGERFSLVAEDGPAEAVCVLPVGGLATTDDGTFAPPWSQ